MACSESRTFRRLLGFIPVFIVGGFVLIFAMDEVEGGIVFFSFAGAFTLFALLVWFVFPVIGAKVQEINYSKRKWRRFNKKMERREVTFIDPSTIKTDSELKKAILSGQITNERTIHEIMIRIDREKKQQN